jgi:hypothetical protein
MSYCELLAVSAIPFANSAIHRNQVVQRESGTCIAVFPYEPHWTVVSTANDSQEKTND